MTLPFALGILRLLSPALLLACAAVPFYFVGLGGRRTAWAAAVCRSIAMVAVVLALAGLQLERSRPESGTCVVAAIDVSASVQRAGLERAGEFLDRLRPRLGGDDLVGALTFASAAHVVAPPATMPPIASLVPAPPTDVSGFETGDTDIAAAVAAAAPLCPEGKQMSLLLFSDGNETTGSVLAEAALTEPRVPIFPIVPPTAALPPASVRRLLAPAFAPEGSLLPLEAIVENRTGGPLAAELQLVANGEPLAREPVDLLPGLSVLGLPYRLRGAGQYLVEGRLTVAGANAQPPGTARTAVTVTRPLHVLVVSDRPAPAAAAALAERGVTVEIVTPAALAPRLSRLGEYHVVVLDDVGHAAIGDAALERVAAWVAAGGALVATGGEHLFGDPGYVASPLARVLPVELQSQSPEPQEREPLALYIVIDRSNSMGYASGQPMVHNGEKMEYAKRAALEVLDQLGPRDLVAAIAFDSQPYELGPLAPVATSRTALAARIMEIQYGGGTDFKEALDIARRHLLESGRRVRHVILLTDGDTNRSAEDHAELIAALARAEITVTTIRIGSDTINLDLLDAISRATGGEFHHVENVHALPQLMIRDTRRLMEQTPDREERRAHLGDPGAILAGIKEDELPPVLRWATTRPKAGAELRLYVEAGERHDPLLATWQYELGRVAVVPLDFQAGAAAWPVWSGFGKLWSQLALWAAPRSLATDRHFDVRRTREGTLVRLETATDDPGPFVLRLVGGDIVLRQVGRRTFSAVVPSLGSGVHPALLLSRGGAEPEPVDVVVPPDAASGREFRTSAPNLALLAALARSTGGAVEPEPAAVLAAQPGVRREVVPLTAWLVPLALVFLLADVALRRIA